VLADPQLKVAEIVVRLVVVDVMHLFVRPEQATERLLHDQAMLRHALSAAGAGVELVSWVERDLDVALPVDVLTAAPVRVINTPGEVALPVRPFAPTLIVQLAPQGSAYWSPTPIFATTWRLWVCGSIQAVMRRAQSPSVSAPVAVAFTALCVGHGHGVPTDASHCQAL
jgi:hypothetical protein